MAKNNKVKKPFYKKVWVWVVAIIVIIAIANTGDPEDTAIEGGENTDTSEEQTSSEENTETSEEPAEEEAEPSEEQTPAEEEPAEEEPAEENPGIGEPVEVGAMTYTINEKTTANQVGPSAFPETANGTYLVLDITAKNNGNEAVTIDGSYFKLKQGDTTFEADSMASMTANQGEDGTIQNSFFMEQLNPGSEMNGKVVYDVAPEIAEANDLQVVAQEGIFGSVTKTIDLQ